MSEEKRFSIGQIAQLCNISPKQLRYFDEKGIIAPEVRDKKNRYRYYSEKQLEKVLIVKEMQGLGFTLKKISMLLDNRNLTTLLEELESHLQDARKEIELSFIRYDRTIELYKRVNHAQSLTRGTWGIPQTSSDKYQFSFVDIPQRHLVFTRYRCCSRADNPRLSRRAELNSIIEKNGLVAIGPHMAIYHDSYLRQFNINLKDSEADIERCRVISQVNSFCPNCRIQNSFRAASTIFVGPYRNIRSAYEALKEWVEVQGLKTAGSTVEVYIVGATITNDENNYVTNILLPLSGYEV